MFNLKRQSHEILGAADRDPDAVIYWDRRLRAAPAADRRGPFSCARIDCAASLAGSGRQGYATAATSSVTTVKLMAKRASLTQEPSGN